MDKENLEGYAPLDGKFGIRKDRRIVNLVSGEAIPEDEPLFMLRGRDHHALEAIQAYRSICAKDCNSLHMDGINQTANRFALFQIEHPERMKQPGITKHLKLEKVAGYAGGAAPQLEWRCFHCDEVFTDRKEARAHFGEQGCEDDPPACIDPLRTDEKARLTELREAREYAAKCRDDMNRAEELLEGLQAEHDNFFRYFGPDVNNMWQAGDRYKNAIRDLAELSGSEEEIAQLRGRLSAIVKWLEANQSDVFKRGLWDALANSAAPQEKK